MKAVIVLPTYNERENISRFLHAVREVTDADVLVIDDNSPDGTAEIAKSLNDELGGIEVLERTSKDGLGSAYRAGFKAVLDGEYRPAGTSRNGDSRNGDGRNGDSRNGDDATEDIDPADDRDQGQGKDRDRERYDVIISMDADLSHDPTVIPEMIALLESGADAVVGSRYVTGGGTTDWPVRRQLLSKWGNQYTRFALGLRVNDCTSGFRAYRREALQGIAPHTTRAEGYAFLTELVRRLNRGGATIAETPIVFRDRTAGKSKMSGRIIAESMALVTGWGVRDRWRRLRQR